MKSTSLTLPWKPLAGCHWPYNSLHAYPSILANPLEGDINNSTTGVNRTQAVYLWWLIRKGESEPHARRYGNASPWLTARALRTNPRTETFQMIGVTKMFFSKCDNKKKTWIANVFCKLPATSRNGQFWMSHIWNTKITTTAYLVALPFWHISDLTYHSV